MPRVFVPAESLRGDHATLDRAAYRHLVKVLRLGPGDQLRVFDGRGIEIDARIESVAGGSLEIALGQRRRLPPPACAITLLMSPPRGERMELIVQKTTELGVARIVPVASTRAMVKPSSHQHDRWQNIAKEASRQSGRADIPTVTALLPLAEALAREAGAPGPRLMLWEGEREQSLLTALVAGPRTVALLVGPEGGFSQAEVALAAAAGFVSVGLGPRILRAETAAIVAVALAQGAAGGL